MCAASCQMQQSSNPLHQSEASKSPQAWKAHFPFGIFTRVHLSVESAGSASKQVLLQGSKRAKLRVLSPYTLPDCAAGLRQAQVHPSWPNLLQLQLPKPSQPQIVNLMTMPPLAMEDWERQMWRPTHTRSQCHMRLLWKVCLSLSNTSFMQAVPP